MLAVAFGADFRVLDGVVYLAAIQTDGVGVDGFDLQGGALEEFLFLGEPFPGVGEVVGTTPETVPTLKVTEWALVTGWSRKNYYS